MSHESLVCVFLLPGEEDFFLTQLRSDLSFTHKQHLGCLLPSCFIIFSMTLKIKRKYQKKNIQWYKYFIQNPHESSWYMYDSCWFCLQIYKTIELSWYLFCRCVLFVVITKATSDWSRCNIKTNKQIHTDNGISCKKCALCCFQALAVVRKYCMQNCSLLLKTQRLKQASANRFQRALC